MAPLTDEERYAPFPPTKRDPHFKKARRISAAILTLVNTAWIVGALSQTLTAESLPFTSHLLFLFGFIYIIGKSPLVADIAMVLTDRREGLRFVPTDREIVRRTTMAFILPLVLLAIAMVVNDATISAGCLTLILLLEAFIFLSGNRHWTKIAIPPTVLKPLLFRQEGEAVAAWQEMEPLEPEAEEITALALATMAFQKKSPSVLKQIEDHLPERQSLAENEDLYKRTELLIKADYERVVDPVASAVAEAQALKVLPEGHPRRLTLALYVASAALEQEDGASAWSALKRIHTREVASNPSRAVVNWMGFKAAELMDDEELKATCLEALRAFHLRQISNIMSDPPPVGEGDAYAKWIRLAKEGLLQVSSQPVSS